MTEDQAGAPGTPKPKKRPRHLMDPDNLQRETIRSTDSGPMHLEPVQKWVLSVLAFTTIIHLSVGLVIAAEYVDGDRLDAQIGLNVIAAAFGVVAVAVFRAIHQLPFLSPWLLLGVAPGLIGLYIVL
ncbi:MAG: hypothetical protein WBP61_03410 [Nocardioides sp.]